MSAPGVAAHDALYSHSAAFKRPMLFYSFQSIGAASRRVPAPGTKPRRYSQLVEPDEAYEYYGEDLFQKCKGRLLV